MLSRADVNTNKVILTKNLVTDQTYTNMTFRANTAGRLFSGSHGVGTATATTTIAVIHAGGFSDQKITAIMRYAGPTTAGTEDFGVICRVQGLEDTNSTNYYYARCSAGSAKLTKVISGSFTNLSTSAFALPVDTDVTITLQAVGSSISATFSAGGSPADVTLSATDSTVPSGGQLGFRTFGSTGYCKFFTAEQL